LFAYASQSYHRINVILKRLQIFMASSHSFGGSVAEYYDRFLGPLLFEPFAADLAGRINGEDLRAVLEVAAGTGRLTRHLSSRLSASAQLVATDINEAMLETAKERVKGTKISWRVADAAHLPFDEASFNLVVCQFGVSFFSDRPSAFREIYRVLRPGGIFLFNTWQSMENNPRMLPMKKAFREVLGAAADEFLKRTPYGFYDQSLIRQLMMDAAFKDVTIEVVARNERYENLDEFFRGFIYGSPLGGFLQKQDEEIRQKFKKIIREEMEEQSSVYGNNIPMQALVCCGRKPGADKV
jgi:ubiquinone/menaquinone biosynthesis C-methylase UbiE